MNTGGPETAPTDWTKKIYNLSAFANQAAYIGIQCVSDDVFIFMIDDIEISGNVGIDDKHQASVLLFPNPAKEKIYIHFQDATHGDIKVWLVDALGRVVMKGAYNLFDGKAEIETNELRPGLYYIVIQNEKETIVKKVTIIE